MNYTDTMTVSKTFTVGALWEAIFSSDGAGQVYWSSMIRNAEGQDIDLWTTDAEGNSIGNPQDFKVYEDEEDKWHLVTLEDLRTGFEKALNEGATHCGGHALDIEDNDACFGDIVVQYATFGELVYG